MRIVLVVLMTIAATSHAINAQELQAPNNWRKEKIQLPPGFAPKLGLVGHEDIRFAPGMFKADSDSFFSYVLAFYVQPKPELSQDEVTRQILIYYQGLASAILKGRGLEVDASAFEVKLKPAKVNKKSSVAAKHEQLEGTLKWVEPFTTAKDQTLLMDIDVLQQPDRNRNIILMCVSPKPRDAEIWKELLAVRKRFLD